MKHLATRKAKENEHTLYDLQILEDSDQQDFTKDKNAIHFDSKPDDEILERLNYHGIKYIVHPKELTT